MSLREEDQAILDGILIEWHQWSPGAVARGWNRVSPGTEGWRCSRQYDDGNGALDAEIDRGRMRTVDFEVRQLEEPYRSAIYVQARALVVGVAVFTSPRLPMDRAEREAVVKDARLQLIRRLRNAGVM